MDTATLQTALIESEIKAACATHGGDVEKLTDHLQAMALIQEAQDGTPVVTVRTEPGSSQHRLALDNPGVPMPLVEFVELLKGSHDFAHAFPVPEQRAEPEVRDEQTEAQKAYRDSLHGSRLMQYAREHGGAPKPSKPKPQGRRVDLQEASQLSGPDLMNASRGLR